jgi:CheY-like chemotaxis protein
MPKLILIAEDTEDDAVVVRQCLKDAGVKNPVVTVDDGEKVIAYLKGENEYADRKKFPIPSILLLDLKMRKVGGFQVMEWLGKHPKKFKNILIVVLSGHQELENVRLAYQLGARSFLTKPCQVEDVKNLIRAYSTCWDLETPIRTPVFGNREDRQNL